MKLLTKNAIGLVLGLISLVWLMAYNFSSEVPIGSVDGKVVMYENGRSLPNLEVILTPITNMPEGYQGDRSASSDKEGKFRFKNVPAGLYTIDCYAAKAHSYKSHFLQVTEGHSTPFRVEMEPNTPYLDLYSSQKVFLPGEAIQLEAHGFNESKDIVVSFFRLKDDSLLKSASLSAALQQFSYRWNEAKANLNSITDKVAEFKQPITVRDSEGTYVENIQAPALKEGIYWINADTGPLHKGTWAAVSRIALITKSAASKTVCFVTDLKTGEPIAGANLSLARAERIEPIGTSATDGTVSFVPPKGSSYCIIASKGNSKAITYCSDRGQDDPNVRIFTYTDRPVYRPGDTVQFKSIARRLTGTIYQIPKVGKITVSLLDPDSNVLQTTELTSHANATWNGSFTLNRECPPGGYVIKSEYDGGSDEFYFQVASYRKPEMTITIKPDKPFFVRGEKATATVSCQYYFGGPVVGAKLNCYVSRNPSWDYGPDPQDDPFYGEYSSGYDTYGGELMADTKLVTDEKGQAHIEFKTRGDDEGNSTVTDYQYSINASVSDASGKYFDGTGQVLVTRGQFGIYAESSSWVTKLGSPVELTIKTFENVSKKPLGGKQVRIVVGKMDYTRSQAQFKPVDELSAQTAPGGTVVVPYLPKQPGYFLIRAIATDNLSNEIVSEQSLWVENGSIIESEFDNPIALTLDKKLYQIGDHGKLLIEVKDPGGSALVANEGATIYGNQVIQLTNKVTIVPFVVTEDMLPNSFLSVAYVRNKRFVEGSCRVNVDVNPRKLTIKITSDKAVYHPKDIVHYHIEASDVLGKPVAADLSLGVVDEAIYAIRPDSTDIVGGFYPMRENSVQTDYSFPELYLDGGDKAPADIDVRSRFLDTAFWDANIQTNYNGVADVDVVLPDNLTTWRATVVGTTDSTQVGMSTHTVVVNKPLMVRLEAPEFMVVGDSQRIRAVLHNNTGSPQELNVELGADGIEVSEPLRQTVSSSGDAAVHVDWTLTAKTATEAKLTVKAWAANMRQYSDGVSIKVPVYPHGRTDEQFATSAVTQVSEIGLMVHDAADPKFGRLRIDLSPSLATSMLGSLNDLIDYPYGCVEQTMSRFLPTVIVSRSLKAFGIEDPKISAKIPDLVSAGFNRLRTMQHYDGGWGWWESDQSSSFMTAMVLHGMALAEENGFRPPKFSRDRAINWALERAKQGQIWQSETLEDKSYLLYALALNGQAAAAASYAKDLKIDISSVSENAWLSLLYFHVGDKVHLEEVFGNLNRILQRTGGMAHWPEKYYGVEATSIGLLALATIRPNDPAIGEICYYLVNKKRGSYWMSTRDSSYALIALSTSIRSTHELSPSYDAKILVNGTEVGNVHVEKGDLYKPIQPLMVPMSALKRGINKIQCSLDGKGVLFVSASLKQAIVGNPIRSTSSSTGFYINREYFAFEPTKMEDGSMRMMLGKRPITEAKAGQLVKCVLTIKADKLLEFVMIESPSPAGVRIMERTMPGEGENWDQWEYRPQVYDDRIVFFTPKMHAGEHRIEYTFRAENPGEGAALPANIFNMYAPDYRASSSETKLKVTF